MSSNAAMTAAFFATFASVAWSAAFAWARWLARPHREPSLEEQNRQFQLEQRVAGIEQAVQAMAAEVTRAVDESPPRGTAAGFCDASTTAWRVSQGRHAALGASGGSEAFIEESE